MNNFSHFDDNGNAYMVDITNKNKTNRCAIASGEIKTSKIVIDLIINQNIKKGDVLNVARIAGISGIKQTSSLIPMCHPLLISHAKIDFEIDVENCIIKTICTVKVAESTGVEMEALTGVSTTLLTIYDMCKAVDKTMTITNIKLDYKSGGKSGEFINE